MTVSTTQGEVRGQDDGGVTRFLGIPYAVGPTGDLRFGTPVLPPAWDGVLDAHVFSATPPKPGRDAPSVLQRHQFGGETAEEVLESSGSG